MLRSRLSTNIKHYLNEPVMELSVSAVGQRAKLFQSAATHRTHIMPMDGFGNKTNTASLLLDERGWLCLVSVTMLML